MPIFGFALVTTLTPNLGIVRRHGKDIVLADIPGLIEGAADGAGLGHDFLRHVERTRLLLHVLDIAGSEGRDPVEDFDQINHELANYGELAERPQIVVCNKSDLPDSEENVARFVQQRVKTLMRRRRHDKHGVVQAEFCQVRLQADDIFF